jgi:hypothetical protein
MDSLDEAPSPHPDKTDAEMFVFVAITIQIGHCLQDQLTYYGVKTYQFHTPIYTNMMKQNISFCFCISLATGMEFTGQQKITTDCGKYGTYYKF